MAEENAQSLLDEVVSESNWVNRPFVLGFYFSSDMRQVVLIDKTHPEWQADKQNGIGGRVEFGETPYQAMCREFHEETGLTCNEWEHFAVLTFEDKDFVFVFAGISDKNIITGIKKVDTDAGEEQAFCARVSEMRKHKKLLPNVSFLVGNGPN